MGLFQQPASAMQRILVTGGAGFIGSHLCERLLAQGHEVLCLDNFFTGSKENIRHLADNRRFEVIRHDIIAPFDLEVDAIFNLACPASPIHYQLDPVRTIQANVLGVTHMLELARRTGARILQASTSEVYGNPQVHPQPETYWGHVNPIGVRSCYDEGKRVAEALLVDYHRQYGVEIRIARIFNTYGPRMAGGDGRVVTTLAMQAMAGEPLTVFGDGTQTRAFCYVDDTVEGLLRLMNHPAPPPGADRRVRPAGRRAAEDVEDASRPVNLGRPSEVTILELARTILRLTGSASPITFRPLPSDDPVRRLPDISRARSLLRWEPQVSLEDGLRLTIEYLKALR
jgi:UDP-glucuronate decarboxylase